MVQMAEEHGCQLEELDDTMLQEIDPRLNRDMVGDISIENCVNGRMSYGGTAPAEVRRQIDKGRRWLESLR